LLQFLAHFIPIRTKSNFRQTLQQKNQGNFLLFKTIAIFSHIRLQKTCSGEHVSREFASANSPWNDLHCRNFLLCKKTCSGEHVSREFASANSPWNDLHCRNFLLCKKRAPAELLAFGTIPHAVYSI